MFMLCVVMMMSIGRGLVQVLLVVVVVVALCVSNAALMVIDMIVLILSLLLLVMVLLLKLAKCIATILGSAVAQQVPCCHGNTHV